MFALQICYFILETYTHLKLTPPSNTLTSKNITLPPVSFNCTELPQNCTEFPINWTDILSAPPDTSPAPSSSITEFYVGLLLAIGSSIFIGSSFILKKKALLRLAVKDTTRRASAGGHGYLKEWMWWAGIITMGVGEASNFAAYAFAPATLVTPLGALSVLVTSILSSRMLNERLNLLGKIGCAVCILGSTIIVIHSPKEENIGNMSELADKMKDPGFIVYVLIVIIGSGLLIVYCAPKYGQNNIMVYVFICSIIGSLSVLGCKGFGLALKETFTGHNQFGNWLTWFWLFSVVFCVSVQINYLNKALDLFNTSMVTPIYYVFFTTFVILASGILFKEWLNLANEDILGNICGFAITVIGIFQMQLFRDVNVTASQLRHMLRNRNESTGPGESVLAYEVYHDRPPNGNTPISDSRTDVSNYRSTSSIDLSNITLDVAVPTPTHTVKT